MKTNMKNIIADLRHLTPFPRRYDAPKGRTADWWRGEMRRYANAEKRIESNSYQWYVIRYDDGHVETARLRVLQGGLFSGMTPAIYRGLIIPRMVEFGTFSHIKELRLAF